MALWLIALSSRAFAQTPELPTYTVQQSVQQNVITKNTTALFYVTLTGSAANLTTDGTGFQPLQLSLLLTGAGSQVVSSTASTGRFTASASGGQWTIDTLQAGQPVSLTFSAQFKDEGINYVTATAPDGSSATTCISVPFRICTGQPFEMLLSTQAPASGADTVTYQWYKNDVVIPQATTRTLSVTATGRYSVFTTNAQGCSDGTCCPFIVEDTGPLPTSSIGIVAPGCQGAKSLNNGMIILLGHSENALSYNLTVGSRYDPAQQRYTDPEPLAGVTNGLLLTDQPNPARGTSQTYVVRVYDANGCYSDALIDISSTVCACPPAVCLPIAVRRIN